MGEYIEVCAIVLGVTGGAGVAGLAGVIGATGVTEVTEFVTVVGTEVETGAASCGKSTSIVSISISNTGESFSVG